MTLLLRVGVVQVGLSEWKKNKSNQLQLHPIEAWKDFYIKKNPNVQF